MSQEITELKAAVEQGMRMYSAFANAQTLVNALASADNYAAEVQVRIDALTTQEAALIASCAAMSASLSADTDNCATLHAEADAYAAQVHAAADATAATIIADAQAAAENRELAADGYVDEANVRLAAVTAQIAPQQAVLDGLNVSIAAAHASIQSLLGH